MTPPATADVGGAGHAEGDGQLSAVATKAFIRLDLYVLHHTRAHSLSVLLLCTVAPQHLIGVLHCAIHTVIHSGSIMTRETILPVAAAHSPPPHLFFITCMCSRGVDVATWRARAARAVADGYDAVMVCSAELSSCDADGVRDERCTHVSPWPTLRLHRRRTLS